MNWPCLLRLRERVDLATRCTLVSVIAMLGASPLPAQHLNAVAVDDLRIRELAWLLEAGLVPPAPVGQGPLSGREIQRLLAAARATVDALDAGHPMKQRAAARLAGIEALAGSPNDTSAVPFAARVLGVGAGLAHLGASDREVLPFNGLGYIDARVNPLGDRGIGRGLDEGRSALGWASATALAASRLELTTRVRAEFHASDTDRRRPDADRLVLGGRVGNAIIAVGRDHVRWGQGFQSSTLFSSTAPPLDMVRVSTDAPVRLPWIFGLAGPLRATLLIADLTGSGHFRGERLAAWKVSVMPWSQLELGATVASQQGGEGAPPARLRARIADLVPLVDAIFLGDRDLQISNKLAGVDARLRLPGSMGLTAYVDLLLDDFDLRRVASTFVDDGAWVAGVALPPIGRSGVGAAVEHHHTGVRFYRHGDFRSGVTHRGELLGNPLGPDADAVYARVLVERGATRALEFRGAVEHRRAHAYVSSGGIAADDGTLRFHVVEYRPIERRHRAVLSLTQWLHGRDIQLDAEGGFEQVFDAAHVAGERQTGVLARLRVTRRF